LREAGKLAAFIKARVRNAADAEDILQDVFLEFVQAYRLPEPIEQISGWLFRVARKPHHRSVSQDEDEPLTVAPANDGDSSALHLGVELPALEGDPEAGFARSAILAALQTALEELPANQRDVFVAHEIEGMSFESLSRRDGVPVNTLLSRKRYAVLHLRQRLQMFYDELET